MKKIFKFIAACLAVGLLPFGTGCTDMAGDGIDSVEWEGSTNPENTCYRNPVWEPTADGATMFKAASGYVVIAASSEWAPGITYNAPILTSTNPSTYLMKWSKNTNDAFKADALPALGEGKVSSISGDWASGFAADKYWVFYNVEGENGICAAHASESKGPFVEVGPVDLGTGDAVVKDPFFLVVAKSYYLLYSTEEGSFLQALTLSTKRIQDPAHPDDPTKKVTQYNCVKSGAAIKVAGPEWQNVALVNTKDFGYFLFGTVGNEIRYARASGVKGPFSDKAGVELLNGSNGELAVAASDTYTDVENPMRAFLNNAKTHIYLAYNATEVGNTVLKSGYARKPMFVQPSELDEDGWMKTVITPKKEWTSPRYE